MAAPLYLLDTSVLLHLIRGKETGRHIARTFDLDNNPTLPLICVVTRGEIGSLARERSWGPEKRAALEAMLDRFVTVDINSDDVIEAYIEIDHASRKAPAGEIRMGKNDLWIAAVTKVTGAILLTCDRDFDHLDPGQIQRIYIDPRQAPGPSPGEPT